MNKKAQTDIKFVRTLLILFAAMFLLFFSGILMGAMYYFMAQTQDTLETIDFPIPTERNNTNITSFQDIADLIYYPILGLRTSLVYISYFFIFAMMLGFGLLAFQSQREPIYFIPYFLILVLYTAFAIPISNIFEGLLTDPFILSMMSEFVIYSKVMLYFPQFIFFTGLGFAAIASIGIIRNKSQGGAYENIEF